MTTVEWLEEQYTKQITFLHREDFEQAKEMEKQQQYEFAIGFLIWYCIEALQNQKYLALSIFELLEIYKKQL